MKTLRLIGMAVLAVVMCVSFTACGDDDEPDTGNGNPIGNKGKRLAQLVWEENILSNTYFHYNADGWLEEVIYTEDDGDMDKITYSYEKLGDNIYVTGTWDDGEMAESIIINNGLIRFVDGEECLYDSENRLIQWGDIKFTWENDNIIKYGTETGQMTTFTYTDKENKFPTYTDPIQVAFDNYDFIHAHPYMVGKYCKNVVKSYAGNVSDGPYTYEFDKDGYVLSFKEEGNSTNELDYKWE